MVSIKLTHIYAHLDTILYLWPDIAYQIYNLIND